MAFSVTPTSGEAPYTFEAEILNTVAFDWGLYSAHLYSVTESGSCPPPSFENNDNQNRAQALIKNGIAVSPSGTIPAGVCGVFNLVFREIATGVVVDSSFVSIDNV